MLFMKLIDGSTWLAWVYSSGNAINITDFLARRVAVSVPSNIAEGYGARQ
jgi:hypothetical protein